jgi:hypothetical protein
LYPKARSQVRNSASMVPISRHTNPALNLIWHTFKILFNMFLHLCPFLPGGFFLQIFHYNVFFPSHRVFHLTTVMIFDENYKLWIMKWACIYFKYIFCPTESLYEITARGNPELNVSCDCAMPSCSEPEYTLIPTATTQMWVTGNFELSHTVQIRILGESGSVVVKALCYKPEGRWFVHYLNLPNPSGRIRPWGSLSL